VGMMRVWWMLHPRRLMVSKIFVILNVHVVLTVCVVLVRVGFAIFPPHIDVCLIII